jgi:hypothetical protein
LLGNDRKEEEEEKEETTEAFPAPLLRTLEDMLYNRIAKKKVEMHKAFTKPLTYKLWTEIETLQLVLSESPCIRRRLLGD